MSLEIVYYVHGTDNQDPRIAMLLDALNKENHITYTSQFSKKTIMIGSKNTNDRIEWIKNKYHIISLNVMDKIHMVYIAKKYS